jgi:hypothetical protein
LLAIWPGVVAARRTRGRCVPKLAQVSLAALSTIAFAATSGPPQYVVRSTLARDQTDAIPTSIDVPMLQDTFDDIAEEYGLKCQICDALAEGRVYRRDWELVLTASFDSSVGTAFFDIRGDGGSRAQRREVDRLAASLCTALGERFPQLIVMEYRSGRDMAFAEWLHYEPVNLTVELVERPLQAATVEAAKRTLSQIVEDVVSEHDLRVAEDALFYFAGRRVGPSDLERELTLSVSYRTNSTFVLSIWSRSQAYETLQSELVADLEMRLRAAFATVHVTVVR